MIQSHNTLPNPFLGNNANEPDDDERLDVAEEDENNGQDFLLPDRVEQEFSFVGDLDGLDLATGFGPFFAKVKKKAVYIEDTDETLVDKTTVSGKSRAGTKSKREPDLVLELKDQSNKTVCELGIGEGTSHAHRNYRKKNAKDLARIGLGLKDALDLIQDKYGVDNATLVGYQVIAQTMSIYLIRRCGNIYVMVHAHDVLIPDSLKELATIGAEYKIWFELALTVESGIKPVLNAAAKGKVAEVHSSLGTGKARLHTVSTPELNRLLKRA
ncbi:hypothetical protein BG006_011377 [Podila minutissima]|uniref:Uncharacterized protein n=1 Tax=Podila minutissima TaxID=64525 RepID=A0A9P5VI52_9FUNG|nr:hypothetical protein BG006_011377 [Podila minutissima]